MRVDGSLGVTNLSRQDMSSLVKAAAAAEQFSRSSQTLPKWHEPAEAAELRQGRGRVPGPFLWCQLQQLESIEMQRVLSHCLWASV